MALQWGGDMATALGNFLPVWNPGWTTATWNTYGVPTRGPATARQWAAAMPYDVEQALIFVIDQQPWVVRQGTRWQVWPHGGNRPWQLSLKRSMGSPASAPVVVRELQHMRGALHSEDLEGLVSVLAMGGSTTLHSGGQSVYVLRSAALRVDGRLQSLMMPAAASVRWRGTQETRTTTVIVMTAGEGRWWSEEAPMGIPEAPGSSSSDEGLPDEDCDESASSSDDASSEEGWSGDSEAEEAAGRDSRGGFSLRVATLNVRGTAARRQRSRPRRPGAVSTL